MAFAAFSLISPIHPSSKEAPVSKENQSKNRAWSSGPYAGDTAGSKDIEEHELTSSVANLRQEVEILGRRQRELLTELNVIREDQMDQYLYARKHLSSTLRLCTQVERIIEHEDSNSRSLEVLQVISRDILKVLERYHAPGTNDRFRFLKQRKIQNAICEDEQMNYAGNFPITSPTAESTQVFKGRPDAPVFVPSSSNGLTNMPQAVPPVISIPTRGQGGSVRISAPSLSLDVAFKPVVPKADESSSDESEEPVHVQTSPPGQICKTEIKDKTGAEESWGPLIPVTESELNSKKLLISAAEKSASTDDFFGPLTEISKPPHRRALKDSTAVTSGNDIISNVHVDAEAMALHGLNLAVVKDFARRAEALRQGDNNAIASTGDSGEQGDEEPLPAVGY